MKLDFSRFAAWMWMAAALAGPALAGEPLTFEPGMDRMGGDYRGFPMRQADPALCQRACADDQACHAYTFVKPGIKGPAAMCFLKSSVPAASANACCTSGTKVEASRSGAAPMVLAPAARQRDPVPMPMARQLDPVPAPMARQHDPVLAPVAPQRDPAPASMAPQHNPVLAPVAPAAAAQEIGAPNSAKINPDPDQNYLSWSWTPHGCFPGGAGQAPVPCKYVQDIDGFKVYDGAGKLVKTLADKALRSAPVGKTGCYLVRAYKGALESPDSERACVEGDSAPSGQRGISTLEAPVNLHATASASECAAATPGVMTAAACDLAIKTNHQPLIWKWSGNPSAIDGFRLYDSYGGKQVQMASKPNEALRAFIIEPLVGVKLTDWCFSVRAYKGNAESKSSNTVCLQALAPVPPPLPPAPSSLHLTKSAAECAAAAGSPLLGFLCDAAIKANGQALVFHWSGSSAIDGYRLYDSYNGKPMLQETKYHQDQHMFIIPAFDGVKLTDFCFSVRAFEGDRESLPSNTVCVDPLKSVPAPVPPKTVTVLQPAGGIIVDAVERHTNFNSGCPFPERVLRARNKAPFNGTITAMYLHRDKNILCGNRTLVWNEGSVEFKLADVPEKFNKATLKFVSNGTVAKVGTEGGFANTFNNPVTVNSVNCVSDLYAYNIGLLDNSTSTDKYGKVGDPAAWFAWHKVATVASATNTQPEGSNAFDVTAVVRQSIKGKQKKQGFNFAVNRAMVADNDMCGAGFKSFTLEIE